MLILTPDESLWLFEARIKKLFDQTKGRNNKRLKHMKLNFSMCHALTKEQYDRYHDQFEDFVNQWWDTN